MLLDERDNVAESRGRAVSRRRLRRDTHCIDPCGRSSTTASNRECRTRGQHDRLDAVNTRTLPWIFLGLLTWLKVCDSVSTLQDHSTTLVSESILTTYSHLTNATMLPEMHIRAANSSRPDVDKAVIWARLGNFGFDQVQRMLWICVNRYVARPALCDGSRCLLADGSHLGRYNDFFTKTQTRRWVRL